MHIYTTQCQLPYTLQSEDLYQWDPNSPIACECHVHFYDTHACYRAKG